MLLLDQSGAQREGAHLPTIGQMDSGRAAILQFIAVGAHSSKMYRRPRRPYPLPEFDIIDYFSNVEQVGEGYARFTGHESLGVYRNLAGRHRGGRRPSAQGARRHQTSSRRAAESMFRNIAADLRAFTRDGPLSARIKCILTSHTFHLVALYRAGQCAARAPGIGVVARVFFEYLIRILYASDISLRSRIGPGLVVAHGHDIVIGADVCIGTRCKSSTA